MCFIKVENYYCFLITNKKCHQPLYSDHPKIWTVHPGFETFQIWIYWDTNYILTNYICVYCMPSYFGLLRSMFTFQVITDICAFMKRHWKSLILRVIPSSIASGLNNNGLSLCVYISTCLCLTQCIGQYWAIDKGPFMV